MTLAIYIHWPYCARICPYCGGTPSLMTAEEIKSATQSVSDLWRLGDDVEIAIEANPHDATARRALTASHSAFKHFTTLR